jgi:hypothetical protein
MTNKREPSPLKGKTVKIKDDVPKIGGLTYEVEDWWQNLSGKSWKVSEGNPACMMYAMRIGSQGIPLDDDVLYGRIDDSSKGLLHLSELVVD